MTDAGADHRPTPPPPAAVPICICVDDFGLHAAVNQAVLALAQRGRISATGALVGGPAWADGARQLRTVATPALQVGLHLDLTEPAIHDGLVRAPLGRLIAASHARRLDAALLRREVERQLDLFEAHWHQPPAFVDGHQHVHQLPQVRDALMQVLLARYPAPGARPWLRCTWPREGLVGAARHSAKAAVIALLGAHALRRLARQHGFRMNGALLGVYDFAGDAARYAQLLQHWLRQAQAGDVLMCHPAAGPVPGDAIAAARQVEYGVLNRRAFDDVLQRTGRVPAPLPRPVLA